MATAKQGMARAAFELLKTTGTDWWSDKSPRLAAALAFYTVLSLAPLLIIVVSVAGLVLGEDRARHELAEAFQGMVGAQASDAFDAITSRPHRSSSIVGTVVGVVVLLVGASGVFGELQSSLNEIWEVEAKPGQGWRGLVRDRIFSFGMVMSVAFVLLVSLVVTAVLTAVGSTVSASLPGGPVLWKVVDFAVGLAANTAIFAAIFKVVPDAEVRWRDVWIGALFTAVLFTIGRMLIGIYLGHSSVGADYGGAGSLVAVVVWVYYSANILFLGAEFTQAYAARYGSRIVPDADAVAIPPVPSIPEQRSTGARKATPALVRRPA